MTSRTIYVIFNPRAGRGQAAAQLRRLRRLLGSRGEFRATSRPGDAVALARQAALEGASVVAAAGGDGTVHEVANGLLQVEQSEAVLAVLPVGSANDYAYSLGLQVGWWSRNDPAIGVRRVEVGVVRGGGRQLFFVNCLGLGFNGQVTRESRRIRALRGVPLYLLATIRAMVKHYDAPALEVSFDGVAAASWPTLALTAAVGQREGNFRLAPTARLDDGWLDYLHVGALSRWRMIGYVPAMISGSIPQNDPLIRSGRFRRMSVRSPVPLIVHADGEFFCVPEEGMTNLEVEILPARLAVLGRLN